MVLLFFFHMIFDMLSFIGKNKKKCFDVLFFPLQFKKISFTIRIKHTSYISALFFFYTISVNKAGVRVATDTAIHSPT